MAWLPPLDSRRSEGTKSLPARLYDAAAAGRFTLTGRLNVNRQEGECLNLSQPSA